jgi:acetyl esterase/lipase
VRKILLWAGGILVVLAVAVFLAFRLSPWPSVLIIRQAFERGAAEASAALEKHLPADVTAKTEIAYAGGGDARLDIFTPTAVEGTDRLLPTVVWVHGGAWVSGTRKNVGNYLRILASYGFTTVAVGYSIAPGATYPTPPRQVNAALAFLQREGRALHVDPTRIVLAGDSAGAQIAAQVANTISVPDYAAAVGVTPGMPRAALRGVVLDCGAFDLTTIDMEGAFSGFLKTVMWAYSGSRDFASDPYFATASVTPNVTAAFPPAFITGGNADPLTPQSRALAERLAALGVPVDTLFFPPDATPPLPHEYQFNLDGAAGRTALDRTVAFLQRVSG